MALATDCVLRIADLSKSFGSTQALSSVSLSIREGTVHALLGGNGSGKSTLIKILAGVEQGDAGVICTRGGESAARHMLPSRARRCGLRFVHQNTSTCAELTVMENLAIGHGFRTGRLGRIRWREQEERAREVMNRFGITAGPRQLLGDFSPAMQTIVAIARAMQDLDSDDRGILVLDEPTAALPASQVQFLLDALSDYARQGQTILYVSHRLEEIIQLAECATVLRNGSVVASMERGELTRDALIEAIAGKALVDCNREHTVPSSAEKLLNVRDLRGGSVQGVTFQLRKGEVLGVAGLLGSGRSTLLQLLFGAATPAAGSIELNGRPIAFRSICQAMAAGFAYVPEDRAAKGLFPGLSVQENLGPAVVRQYWRRGFMSARREHRDTKALMSSYLVKSASTHARIGSLSGGNQQKVLLARWMRRDPQVLLLDEPTQGVDVGARAEIYSLIRRVASTGAGVIVVSSDFEELAALSDRVLILQGGRTVNELTGDAITDVNINHGVLQGRVATDDR
jgi:ribose transport system ATP-binding protein